MELPTITAQQSRKPKITLVVQTAQNAVLTIREPVAGEAPIAAAYLVGLLDAGEAPAAGPARMELAQGVPAALTEAAYFTSRLDDEA